MQTNTGRWLAGLAMAISIMTLGNAVYQSNNDTVSLRLASIEETHRADVATLRKEQDEDIVAVRLQIGNMESNIQRKLDSILASTVGTHVSVKVNESKINRMEEDFRRSFSPTTTQGNN